VEGLSSGVAAAEDRAAGCLDSPVVVGEDKDLSVAVVVVVGEDKGLFVAAAVVVGEDKDLLAAGAAAEGRDLLAAVDTEKDRR